MLHRPVGTPRIWRLSLLVLLLLVAGFSLQPNPSPGLGSGWDKLDHFAAFAALTVNALIAFPGARWPVVSALLLGYGGAIELAQAQVPGRAAEWGDALADAVGIGIGLASRALWLRKN